MATAKKLPSGSWRCLVYSHSVPVLDEKGMPVLDAKGKPKEKRIYESFTSNDPSRYGKLEAEQAALDFLANKSARQRPKDMTLREAINKYISDSDAVLSPTTISGYKTILKNAFSDIMDLQIGKLTNPILREAVNKESKRKSDSRKSRGQTISPKTVSNEYGLITAVLNLYNPQLDCTVKLPAKENKFHDLIPPEIIMDVVKGTDVELPVLLAMWLSFTMSEIKGLTKSNSINGDYITITEVVVNVEGKDIRKSQAKVFTRNRRHKMPAYIKTLIDQIETDELVTMSGKMVYHKFTRLLKKNGLPHMSFHDLRHVNASVMALLNIPDKYAMERGGWKSDKVMKKVYMQTFSEQRNEVDQIIDKYFESKMQHEMQHEKKKVP